MKIHRENFGFNNFNKIKMLTMFSIYIFFFVIFLSVGFAAFQESLYLQDISARVNFDADIRVSNFKVETATDNAEAANTDYNYNRIVGDIILPNSTSTVTYEVSVTNLGNSKVGIAAITGLNENLTYTLTDYILGDPLIENGEYTLGITQKFLITIGYAEGATPVATTQSFNLEFDFRPFHTITYHGVPGDELFPSEILDGLDLVITSELTSIERLKVTMDTVFLVKDEHYTYDENTHQLRIENVTGDLLLSYRDITYMTSLASNTAYFKEYAYKTSIKNIEFVNYVDVTNAVKTYDLSESGDNSVVGWLIKNDDSTYNLYVGSVYDIYTKTLENAFSYMSGLEYINFENLNTSESTSFSYTFYQTMVTNLDLSTFNTSSATTMTNMFAGMTNLQTLDVSNFNTSNVQTMWSMFGSLSSLTELDISSFNTATVNNMAYMFSGMTNLKTLKLGARFNTSSVTTMENMFTGLRSLQSIDVSMFDTTNVKTTKNMFYNCATLKYLDLSSFELASVTNMTGMFYNMSNLETLIIDNFNTSSATNMSNMFANCSKLSTLDVTHFDTSKVTNMSNMFANMYALQELDLSNFITTSVTNMSSFITYCNVLTTLDLRQADFTTVKSSSYMFEGAPTTLTVIVKDADAQTWIQDKLGEGVGTVVLVTDLTQ